MPVTEQTTVEGGVSTPTGLPVNFTKDNWWQPQSVLFGVDDKALSIPKSADIRNSVEVDCIRATALPHDCIDPSARPTLSGLTAGAFKGA